MGDTSNNEQIGPWVDRSDSGRAVARLRELRCSEPANPVHTLNLAICLAQLFQPEESLALYDELCRHKDPPLPAVLGRAELHYSMGRPDGALASLDPFRDRFWKEPAFVMVYMSTAYAAGREDAAHEAIIALNSLQAADAVKPEVFRAVPKDEALEVFKQSFKQAQDRNQSLHADMLKGRMPWVWVEKVSNNATYWGWRTRTQPMGWIGDDPTNRAQYCIYSTNGFHPRVSEQGKLELLPLECPPPGTKVVADISALITLHRLGLLDAAAERFGEVLVPAGYLPTVLEDSRQMVLHQRSRQQSAEQIAHQITAGRIAVLADTESVPTAAAVVDEYAESTEHRYRLADVMQPLAAEGIVSDADMARVSRVCAQPPAVNEKHPPLGRFQDVLVDLTTLETIARSGLLDVVANFYKIRITAQAHREVVQRLDTIAWQEETRQWHLDLWTRLRDDARFRFVPQPVPEEMRDKGKDAKDYLPFLATFMAKSLRLPLLVDERVCQALMLNQAEGVPQAAFGSDVLVLGLMAAGKLDVGKAAVMIRQLLMWRYRFIVLPPQLLKALADAYRASLPGQHLCEVADYVHDCMRDTGLFGGPEKTEMGESMAMRCYLAWVAAIAEFLIMVWVDDSYPPDALTALTRWCCHELLPSTPRVADGRLKMRTGVMTPHLFISRALVASAMQFGNPRMADAMRAIRDALHLTEDEYSRNVMETLNAAARTRPHA